MARHGKIWPMVSPTTPPAPEQLFCRRRQRSTGHGDFRSAETGLHSRYLTQRHKVDVVFYAPEGDLVELHDTAQCELQVLDGKRRSTMSRRLCITSSS